jgi:GH15 family glucan-1,4-alpha-glucosidase
MRTDGYTPIEAYAAIGDGRTVALVAQDGAIDWLCLPNVDSPSVFAAILDAGSGGSFALQPDGPFVATRRYLPDTNVLETTFQTDTGIARVVDALTLPDERLVPMRELVRVVHGASGHVRMRWRVTPRFGYASARPRFDWRAGCAVATWQSAALAVCDWTGGTAAVRDEGIEGQFDIAADGRATLALSFAYGEPLVLPSRPEAEARVEKTARFWRDWIGTRTYQGGWSAAVRRSALLLKLLIFAPSGASTAAPTTSLPEAIGGPRNWDYRFCWIRDSTFAIDALLSLCCFDEAQSLFWWFMQATALTEPKLHVLYRLDGGSGITERNLPLAGYRNSRPVRVGNAAVEQAQHDVYGAMLQTAWIYSEGHRSIDTDTGIVLGRLADRVCDIWRLPDSGIWEVRNGRFHFTHSKVSCWVALDRAIRLAERGEMPDHHLARWRREAGAIARFVEEQCWSERLHSYTRIAGADGDSDQVDASLLILPLVGFGDPRGDRIGGTIDAITRELRRGDLVYRYRADDGLAGTEGCFLNASFWLVGGLARAGRLDEAASLMDSLIGRANDVGLYSEEVDPHTGAFLGNFPQALVHLALIDAAIALQRAGRTT